MRLIKTGGNVIHKQLSFSFHMVEQGGSCSQKYNNIAQEYVPDRTLTPLVIRPQLFISDPEKIIPDGEYATKMVNVRWIATLTVNGTTTTLVEGTDYTVDTSTYAITFARNVAVTELVNLSFTGNFYDAKRKKNYSFAWEKDLTTIAETEYSTAIVVNRPTKVNLSPFKNMAQFAINAQLMNGEGEMPDDLSTYLWEVFDSSTKEYRAITEDDLWYVSGADTKQITVDQDYLQHTVIRATAYPTEDKAQAKSKTILLRRFYGQYDVEAEFQRGKYIDADTKEVVIEAKITNRQGVVSNPCKYFDIEIFYRSDATAEWQSVCYGTEALVEIEAEAANHQAGVIGRELSAFMPVELPDGTILCDDAGNPIVIQTPISTREVE